MNKKIKLWIALVAVAVTVVVVMQLSKKDQ